MRFIIDLNIAHGTAKDDEIAVMNKLVAQLHPTNTYLASFFTLDLARWFALRVNDDVSTDLLAAYLFESGACNALKKNFTRKPMITRSWSAAPARKLFSFKKQIRHEPISSKKKTQAITELQNSYYEMETRYYELKSQKELEVEALSCTITQLKAKLYDMITRKKSMP